MTTYVYPDAYLARFCTDGVETRALDNVALYGTFPDAWTERLTIVQAYIIACLENQADAEDLFTAKLKSYRSQFDILLPQAQTAAAVAAGTTTAFSLYSIPLERA